MLATVTNSLQSLLMEEGRVCLPGIGTLLVVEQPAMVSLIEGKAAAPCARVAFNANLVVDDGRLRREIGTADAEAFVRQTRESLDAGRTVILDGIGKLYPHQGGEIRFSPGVTNFDKNTFGLPEIDVRPIVRKERTSPAAVSPPAKSPAPPPAAEPVATTAAASVPGTATAVPWDQRHGGILWYAAGLIGLLVVLYLLFLLGGAIGNLSADADRADRRQRDTPSETAAGTERRDPVDANDVRPAPAPRLDDDPAPPVTDPAPARNRAIIAIGLYGRQRNVDKQVRRLSEAGYTPYTDREGRNTRLGVEVLFRDEAELQQILREVRARYTREAFVMRVNGEERRPD